MFFEDEKIAKDKIKDLAATLNLTDGVPIYNKAIPSTQNNPEGQETMREMVKEYINILEQRNRLLNGGEIIILAKGKVLLEMIGKPSTALWDMDESGRITFIYVLSDEYLDEIKLGGHYDFACKKIGNVLFLCVKCGDFDWISAPYSPHLTGEYNFKRYEDGKGKPTTILVVNNANGVIQQMDLMGIGTEISNKIENFTDGELAKIADARYSID